MDWLELIVEAILCSAMLFIAHGLSINSKYIEKRMARGDRIAFVAGLFYYAAFMIVPIYLCHRLILKL